MRWYVVKWPATRSELMQIIFFFFFFFFFYFTINRVAVGLLVASVVRVVICFSFIGWSLKAPFRVCIRYIFSAAALTADLVVG